MIELHIPEPTPSLNAFYGVHWTKKAKIRKHWSWLVRAARMHVRVPMLPPEHCKLTIERYGQRLLDRDNLIGGCKGLVDALVAEGFMVDDSPAHLTADYHQFIGKPYRTIIKIEGNKAWNLALKAASQSNSQPVTQCATGNSSKSAVILAEQVL